jgi:uncharacterized membrane protein
MFFIILRVQKRLIAINIFSVIIAGGVLAFTSTLAQSQGMNGLAIGWLIGHLLPALVVVVIFIYVGVTQGKLTFRQSGSS